jgi:beta-glucanase (GH16 family)
VWCIGEFDLVAWEYHEGNVPMKRLALVVATAVVVGGGFIVTGPAEAASGISIRTIPAKTVAYGGSVVIKPLVIVRGKVKISSKRLNVKHGSTYIRKNVTSATLRAGYYGVTTVVKYRVVRNGSWTSTRTTVKTQSLRITSAAQTLVQPIPTPTPTTSDNATSGTTTPCGAQTYSKADGSAWVCTFDDEFDGTELDGSKWVAQETASSGYQNGGDCFINSPNNISVSDGALLLTTRKESAPFNCVSPLGDNTTQYTSGMVSTYGRFAQAYGRFEIRAKFPASTLAGLHGALWLWPVNPTKYGGWPLSGEIDIAEHYSQYADRVIPYIHYGSASTDTSVTNNFCMIDDASSFHTYVAEWTSTTIKIMYDGKTCVEHTISPSAPMTGSQPFDQPFIVALTQALGQGTNALTSATPLPATTAVDYVRVWS